MKDILSELEGKDYTANVYEKYDIRFCRENEYEDLKSFIGNYWKKNHIFSKAKEVFDFQHLNPKLHLYNYVIARSREDNEIHAILGFVPTSQYDSNIKRMMVWPCIWQSRKDIDCKGLGVSMYHYLKNHKEIETISIMGITEIALSIYKHWNFITGKVEQFVMPNFKAQEHLSKGLLNVYSAFDSDIKDTMELRIIDLQEYLKIPEDSEIFKEYSLYKSKMYYVNRFFRHPIYKYSFLAIIQHETIKSIIVVRRCGVEEDYCLRIVDYIGSIKYLSYVKNQLQALLEQNNYEYLDFVEVGLPDEELIKAGFINRRLYENVIVPHYFEPFQKKNVDLDYAFKTVVPDSKIVFFKADSDQDRPNSIYNNTL